MQNNNIFEKILTVTDTSHICSEIVTNYRIANVIKDNDFKHVYVVYGLQENQPLYIRITNILIDVIMRIHMMRYVIILYLYITKVSWR